MGFFSKSKPPIFRMSDIGNNESLASVIIWFIENDTFVKVIKNRSSNEIYNEGFRPIIFNETNPENFKKNITTLLEWFMIQISIDLSGLKNISEERLKEFLDVLGSISDKSLITVGELSIKYGLDMAKFSYEEVDKISEIKEREEFKRNLLLDNVVSAELRILGWLYHEWFNKWYEINK